MRRPYTHLPTLKVDETFCSFVETIGAIENDPEYYGFVGIEMVAIGSDGIKERLFELGYL